MKKSALRNRMRVGRARYAATGDGVCHGEAVRDRLFTLASFRRAHRVCLYLAMPGELETEPLRRACLQAGMDLCVPAWCAATHRYSPARLAPPAACVPGPLGIVQPRSPEWIPAVTVEWVLTPGLAFDRHGGRLGQGGGWYDRLLQRFPAACRRIGLACDWQIVPRVPMEPHDVRLDGIVTEKRVVWSTPAALQRKPNTIPLENAHEYRHHRTDCRRPRCAGRLPHPHSDRAPTSAFH